MFIPVFLFGLLAGIAYGSFDRVIRHRELAVAVLTVIFWLALYLFERSSANMLGYLFSLIAYLGIPATLLDSFLLTRVRSPYDGADAIFGVEDVAESVQVLDHLR
jgi:hypothetical protein